MKRQLRDAYPLIPEGEQVVRIVAVDDSEYAKFDKLVVTLENENGITTRHNFNFVDREGKPNDAAEGIYTRMCRAAMDDQTLDECDTDELIGRFVTVEIVHNTSDRGGTFANVAKWLGPGEPFTAKRSAPRTSAKPSASASSSAPKKSADQILAELRAKKKAAGA